MTPAAACAWTDGVAWPGAWRSTAVQVRWIAQLRDTGAVPLDRNPALQAAVVRRSHAGPANHFYYMCVVARATTAVAAARVSLVTLPDGMCTVAVI